MTGGVISVALIDDHDVLLRELAAIVSGKAGYRVADTGGAADCIPRIAAESAPDLMVIDLSMPGDVFAGIAEARAISPQTRIMVFTAYADVELALRAFEAGADAFVIKGMPGLDFFDAISACLSGQKYVSEPFRAKFEAGTANRSSEAPE